MGSIGNKPPFPFKCNFKPVQHGIESPGQTSNFVVGALVIDPAVQSAPGNRAGYAGDAVNRAKPPVGQKKPAQRSKNDGEGNSPKKLNA